jgi:hypothetical protein
MMRRILTVWRERDSAKARRQDGQVALRARVSAGGRSFDLLALDEA